MPATVITYNGNDPVFSGSFTDLSTQTPLPSASAVVDPGSGVVVVVPSTTQSVLPLVGGILNSNLDFSFDGDYLEAYTEKTTANRGVLIEFNSGSLIIPRDMRIFESKLNEDVFELLPPLPATPPFAPPVFRKKYNNEPVGILHYNTNSTNFGRLVGLGQVVAIEKSNVLLVADAYNYRDSDTNQEVVTGLEYVWRIDGKIVSTDAYLFLPEIARKDLEPYTRNSYNIQIEVFNGIGTIFNSIDLLVWGGEENNVPIDIDPSIPFQIENGFFYFWDQQQTRLLKVFPNQVTDLNGNLVDFVFDFVSGQVPTSLPTATFTTITGDRYEYNVSSAEIAGILRRTRYVELLPRTLLAIWGRKNFKGGNYFLFNYSHDTIFRVEIPTSKRDIKSLKLVYLDDFNNYLNMSQIPVIQWPTSITKKKFDAADILHWLGATKTDAELVIDIQKLIQ